VRGSFNDSVPRINVASFVMWIISWGSKNNTGSGGQKSTDRVQGRRPGIGSMGEVTQKQSKSGLVKQSGNNPNCSLYSVVS
jgi:hypothetical protein